MCLEDVCDFVRLICCQPFWLSIWVSWISSREEKLWHRSLLRGSGGGENVVWVWKLEVLGVGYDVGLWGLSVLVGFGLVRCYAVKESNL